MTITVVGLGPAGPELLARAALDALRSVPVANRYLRTERHPAAGAVEVGTSFDRRYESAQTLDEVYEGIVADLAAAHERDGDLVYAVPGSPLVAEHTVELLRAALPADQLRIVPALSFLDLAWVRLGVDPLAAGVRLVDGHRFATEAAGERGPLLVAQCDSGFVLSDVKLAVDEGPETPVVLLQRLGLPDEVVLEVPWSEIDRALTADHLTTLWIPSLEAPVAAELSAFHETVRTLRERCPWDRAQTHESLVRYLLEESEEAVTAIRALDPDDPLTVDDLCDELGDVLFQVVFHATIAEQDGLFTLADVARGIDQKLIRRHPHVFAGEPDDLDTIHRRWQEIKAAEKAERATRYSV